MKDRGNIKWSAMMLPEHKKLLEKVYAQEEYVDKPTLSQDKCEEINRVLLLALSEKRMMRIKFYHEHTFQLIEGILTKYVPQQKKVKIVESTGRTKILDLDQIVDGEII